MGVIVDLIFPKIKLGFLPWIITMIQIHSDHQCCIKGTNEITLDKDSSVPLMHHKAIPIKCFVSHRRPSREGGSVGRAKKKKKTGTIT